METANRFAGLKLTEAERQELRRMDGSGRKMKGRTWRRVRVLLLLDQGRSVRETAEAVGGYPREISRVGKRYLSGGLRKALTDEPRPRKPRLLDSTQEAAVVALACGPAPKGCARWTVRLLAQEAVRRGVSKSVGRETVRVVLARHDLKPWREKNVVCADDR